MRRATAILVTAIFVGLGAVAPAQTTLRAAGTSKINPKDGLTYVWIPPATFRMGCLGAVSLGSEECLGNELPRHSVTLSKGFWLGQTLVTQLSYRRLMGIDRSAFRGDQLPVDTVSWEAAKAFCERVGMRLPTEAEWEWAARGSIPAERYGPLVEIAWYRGNSVGATHAVRQKLPNPYGLYDMLGNVWEWVVDWYALYRQVRPCCDDPGMATVDPHGPMTGEYHVIRGGSWNDFSADVRMSLRDHPTPSGSDEGDRDYTNYSIGFRRAPGIEQT